MAKKQLNTTAIANELAHSAFFSPPSPAPSLAGMPAEAPISAPAVPHPSMPAAPSIRSTGRTTDRQIQPFIEPSIDRSNGRTTVRHSFDILADQLFSLRKIALTREQHTRQRVLLGDL